MAAVRRCIERGCPELTTRSRCAFHEAERERNRRTPSQEVTETYRWKKLRRELIATRPWVCAICGKRIATEAEIEGDHIIPVSEGGAPFDPANVRLSHRRCNRRRPTRAREPWPTSRAHRFPWMND